MCVYSSKFPFSYIRTLLYTSSPVVPLPCTTTPAYLWSHSHVPLHQLTCGPTPMYHHTSSPVVPLPCTTTPAHLWSHSHVPPHQLTCGPTPMYHHTSSPVVPFPCTTTPAHLWSHSHVPPHQLTCGPTPMYHHTSLPVAPFPLTGGRKLSSTSVPHTARPDPARRQPTPHAWCSDKHPVTS